jgi:hypothetical protein
MAIPSNEMRESYLRKSLISTPASWPPTTGRGVAGARDALCGAQVHNVAPRALPGPWSEWRTMPVSCQLLPTARTGTEAARVLAELVVMSAMAGDELDSHRNQLLLEYAALVIYASEASSTCAHNAQPQSLKDDSQAPVSCGYPAAASGKSFCRMVCWVFSLRAAALRCFCVQQLRNRCFMLLRCVKGSGAAACETACLRNGRPHFFAT